MKMKTHIKAGYSVQIGGSKTAEQGPQPPKGFPAGLRPITRKEH